MQPHDQPSDAACDFVGRVHAFNRIGQYVPPGNDFNADRVCFYTGMQLEELGEKITAIAGGAVMGSQRAALAALASALQEWGQEFKAGNLRGCVLRADREQLLDADIDVGVVTLGAMMYQTPRFAAAINHVLDCNDAKCPGGVATRDENGKIMKPLGWTPPDLTPFVVPPHR